jgi:hypothetical protein
MSRLGKELVKAAGQALACPRGSSPRGTEAHRVAVSTADDVRAIRRRVGLSRAMASAHETATGLHAAGVMDRRTMRRFDEARSTPVRPPIAARPARRASAEASAKPYATNARGDKS